MKVKFRENVYTPIPTERYTCVGCVFLSANKGMCKAPDSIYIYILFQGQSIISSFSKIF